MSSPAAATLARSASRLPHPGLRAYVESYLGYRYDVDEPGIHHGIPGTTLTVVLAIDRPIDVGWLGDEPSRGRYWTLASGLSVSPAAIYQDGCQHGITFGLTPLGARALLGMPAAPLSGQLVSLDQVVGLRAAALHDAVASAPGWPARFAALDRGLLALVAAQDRRRLVADRALTRAWQRLHAAGGRLAIAGLAREVGWSRRHLSQRFADEFGIGPKQTARLIRFGIARGLVVAGNRPLADIAHDCGFADQAHLTREWRELSGLPPIAWLEVERPFLQDAVEHT